jgi:hypothetical protein
MTFRLDPNISAVGITSCDNRLDKLEKRIEGREEYFKVLGFAKYHSDCIQETSCSYVKNNRLDAELLVGSRFQRDLKMLKLQVKIIQVEKQIYKALLNSNNNALFPLFLAKTDELISLTYELAEEEVKNEFRAEGDYLAYCKNSLEQRSYIKRLCDCGASEERWL